MPARSKSPERFSFANLDEVLTLPDLVSIQRGLVPLVPRPGAGRGLHRHQPDRGLHGAAEPRAQFDPTDPDLRPPPKFSVEECKEKDMT